MIENNRAYCAESNRIIGMNKLVEMKISKNACAGCGNLLGKLTGAHKKCKECIYHESILLVEKSNALTMGGLADKTSTKIG